MTDRQWVYTAVLVVALGVLIYLLAPILTPLLAALLALPVSPVVMVWMRHLSYGSADA